MYVRDSRCEVRLESTRVGKSRRRGREGERGGGLQDDNGKGEEKNTVDVVMAVSLSHSAQFPHFLPGCVCVLGHQLFT